MTSLPDVVLEGHLRQYAAFSDADRTRILAAVIKNYGRSVDRSDPNRRARWQAAAHDLTTMPLTKELVESHAHRLSIRVAGPRSALGPHSLLADIGAAVQQTPMSAEYQLGLALDMHEQGLAPVLAYAFNRWITSAHASKAIGQDLAELTIMGLYRLAGEQPTVIDPSLLASGSAAHVIRTGTRVRKHPKNYAAREVLLPLEFVNYQVLARTGLRDRIPPDAEFDPATQTLHHAYVPGTDGESILRTRCCPNPQQRADLRSLYSALLCELPAQGLVLDLHPGNFVWDIEGDRWVLIDIGPIPRIGSEEYFVEDFGTYYTHTWLNRLIREYVEPIRSIDYNVGTG